MVRATGDTPLTNKRSPGEEPIIMALKKVVSYTDPVWHGSFRAEPRVQRAEVVSKYIHRGKREYHRLRLTPWGDWNKVNVVTIRPAEWEKLKPADIKGCEPTASRR